MFAINIDCSIPMYFVFVLLCLLVSVLGSVNTLIQERVIQTVNGPVKGVVKSQDGYQVLVFYGIPFAQPPIHQNRFRSPQPLNHSWINPRDCTSVFSSKMCVQFSFLGKPIGTEDCLYLDVYVPLGGLAPRPLPVMFWIFGGGYVVGDSREFGWYDGKRLAHEKQMIVVAPNYRLNVFGFLASEQLQAEDEQYHSTGNQGLQDQTMALRWVQKNIPNFQGDPEKVTIFGESAGAFSVCWHLVSPASAGMFSRAIMESGTCSAREFFQPLNESFALGQEFAESVGCGSVSSPQQLSCLRSKVTGQLATSLLGMLNSNWPFTKTLPKVSTPLSPIMPFGPPIDGSFQGLLDVPQNLLEKGTFNKVPTIMGTNANEGSIFVVAVPMVVPGVLLPLGASSALKAVEHFFNSSISTVALSQYSTAKNYNDAVSQLLTDYFFACATRRAARALSKHGVDVYLYHFVYKLHFIEAALLGDYHTSELDFVWNNPWPPVLHAFNSKDKKMAAIFDHYWSNLAHSGNPNLDSLGLFDPAYLAWPRYQEQEDVSLVMDVPAGVERGLKRDVCDFWDHVTIKAEYL